jgi:alkaline phosphatase
MIARAHQRKKLVRLWGAPDMPETWQSFRKMGIDIINTDKVKECQTFFRGK